MKKIILTVAAVFAMAFANAQDGGGGMKFGVKAGYVNSNLTGDIETDSKSSAYFGGLVDFSISAKFHIQPEVLYSMEGGSDDGAGLDFISIPIMAKYYISDKFNIQAGPQIAFVAGGDDFIKDSTKSTDFRLGLGAAYEMAGGLFFDARYNLGLSSIADGDGDVKTQSFNVGLGYRF